MFADMSAALARHFAAVLRAADSTKPPVKPPVVAAGVWGTAYAGTVKILKQLEDRSPAAPAQLLDKVFLLVLMQTAPSLLQAKEST